MKEKYSTHDIVNMFYSQKRQAEIAGIAPSTWNISLLNPHWPSTLAHLNVIKHELIREITHSISSTTYPEHRVWLKAMLKYLKTTEPFNDE